LAVLSRIRWALWLPLLAFALYGLMLARYSAAYAGGSDSSGYMNNARLLDHANLVVPMRQVPGVDPQTLPPFTYVPLGFTPRADNVTMVPTYPMGLPLLLMAMAHVVGWNLTASVTMIFHALLGLWLVYLLGREFGLEPGWAWAGAMILAASPLYIDMSLGVMSDVPALTWVTAGVLCALKSRQRPWLALIAGAAVSVAVLDRPTNLFAFVPVGLALGISVKRWLLLIVGGMPGAAFVCAVNQAAYGHLFATGYAGQEQLLSWSYVPGTLLHYAIWLPALFTPLVVFCLGLPALARSQPRQSALLATWAGLVLGFYTFYPYTHESWWILRYILPAVPPLLVAAMMVARALGLRMKLTPRAWWLALAAVAILASGVAWFRHFGLDGVDLGERSYPESSKWMASHLPPNAVVFSVQTSGCLLFYTKFTVVRWEMVSPAQFEQIAAACSRAGLPVFASLHRLEVEEHRAFQEHLTGRWTQLALVGDMSIWRYDSPRVTQ
jgi:hypothetical protein